MRQQELIREIRRNVDDLYMHEDDSVWIMDNLDLWEEQGYDSAEDMECAATTEDNAAHQLNHVIECELSELSEMLGRKVTMEDFTDDEFSS